VISTINPVQGVLSWLQDDWEEGAGINGITMFWLARFFIERCPKPAILPGTMTGSLIFHSAEETVKWP
jgi:hypothetical protein